MLKLGKSVHKLVSLVAPRNLTSATKVRSYTVSAERTQSGETHKKIDLHSFIDEVLSSTPISGTAPTISRFTFDTDNVGAFRSLMQSQTIKTENDVLSILGHLITLSKREPNEVAAWVNETNFPSVVASHSLKDETPASAVIVILGSLYVLGYNRVTQNSTSDDSVSILHSFQTLIPELNKRLMDILKGTQTELPMSSIISFVATLNSLNVSIDSDMKALLQSAIELNIGALSSPSDVITILRHMDLSQGILLQRVLAKAVELVPVMSNGEMVSIFKFLSDQKKRDIMMLSQLGSSLSRSPSPLTMNQTQTLAYSSSILNYRDNALLRRISQEIQTCSSQITNWNSMRTLMGSLIRLGIGDKSTWACLVNWMSDNLDKAPKTHLAECLLNCGQANVLSPTLKQVALSASGRFSAPAPKECPIIWLNSAYAMTELKTLRQNVAEKLLRKEFIAEITGRVKGDLAAKQLLSHKLKIAKINAATKYSNKKYSGSRLNREDIFENSTELIENISKFKQRKPAQVSEFRHTLSFLASASHLSPITLTEDCIIVDAFAELSADGRFVNVKDWDGWLLKKNTKKDTKRLAFMLIPFNQTLRNTASGSEHDLRPNGDYAMDIKHLGAQGFKVVLFYEQEFPAGMEEVERVHLVKERLKMSLNGS